MHGYYLKLLHLWYVIIQQQEKSQAIDGLACTRISFLIIWFYLSVSYPDISEWQWHRRRVTPSHGQTNLSCFSIIKGLWQLWGLWGLCTTHWLLSSHLHGRPSANGGEEGLRVNSNCQTQSHSLNLSWLKSFSEVHVSKLGFSISVFSIFYICACSTRRLGNPPHLFPFNLFLFCRALQVVLGACEDNSINLTLPW